MTKEILQKLNTEFSYFLDAASKEIDSLDAKKSEIRSEIISALTSLLPNIDVETTGTPERDMFVEAPISGQLITLWNKIIYAAKLHAPLVYYADLEESDINNYCICLFRTCLYNIYSCTPSFRRFVTHCKL